MKRKIIVDLRADDAHVCFADNPHKWEVGKSADQALGKFLIGFAGELGVEIEFVKTEPARFRHFGMGDPEEIPSTPAPR